MKHIIRNEVIEEEKVLEWWLENVDGDLHLKCELLNDSDLCSDYYIISITKEGYLKKHTNIPEKLGLKIDSSGTILEEE